MYSYICIHIYIVFTLFIYMYSYILSIYMYSYICIHIHIVFTYIFEYMYSYICIHIYVFIYKSHGTTQVRICIVCTYIHHVCAHNTHMFIRMYSNICIQM